jgi:hypothetical protein
MHSSISPLPAKVSLGKLSTLEKSIIGIFNIIKYIKKKNRRK